MKKINNTIDNNILKEFLKIKKTKCKKIESIDFQALPWLKSIEKLPNNIKLALLIELQLGNVVSQVQDCDWPQKGSIVILLKSSFRNKNLSKIEGISLGKMNDAHYWMEDVHTIVDGIEYLIIT